ncbi:2-polyprenyl-6-methoxyphenol hydroxylase [Actinoalloteichus sp. AHMU CJ021]|uniref:FAD-dependent monooxygenase n=1 Tax=Actinoalloteichus sp. AHMU CJ021 TaxID=2072503 RepID=UPI000CA03705|nr:2-polyprenyl-6-methoxyphenol hydroxylase [Actinoalloteichus sp. AHMU CJ021]
MQDIEVEVLIVGGGPVGLAASVELSRHGVRSLLVERHEGTSIFPKARLLSTRTMELVRAWGVEDEVERVGLPRADSLALGIGSSLTAPDFRREAVPLGEDVPQSPTYTYLCAQDRFEVVLRRLAESQPGGAVRFATTMTGFEDAGSGITAVIESEEGRRRVTARYLVAADGARSGVRESLGIGVDGPPPLSHMVSIMFDADLGDVLGDRISGLFFVRGEVACAVEAVDNQRRWMIQAGYDPSLPEDADDFTSAEDFTEEVSLAVVRAAVGVPDLPVELVGIMPWTQQAVVAREFRRGRVFLVGDAAHVATPQGGFGMNCGLQDVGNLCWKLAAVLRGQAGPGLLNTYEVERRPVAEWTVGESLANALITARMMEGELSVREAGDQQADRRRSEGLVLGYRYESAAVVPDGSPLVEPEDPYRTYLPTARPGHRAPHVWLDGPDGRVSTLDVLGRGFTLLTPEGSGWADVARAAVTTTGVPLTVVEVGVDGAAVFSSPGWAEAYGVGPAGAVLVRPDGHVAWRRAAGGPDHDLLVEVVASVLATG